MQGDAKSDLSEWADEHDADLLIVAASSASGLRKTFGTSTSTYLIPVMAEARMLQGDAKSDLSEWADEHDADLLIVAASSASGLRKTFGTSTSTYLIHHATCPTLVIPVHIALAGVESVTSPTESRELHGERCLFLRCSAAAHCFASRAHHIVRI